MMPAYPHKILQASSHQPDFSWSGYEGRDVVSKLGV